MCWPPVLLQAWGAFESPADVEAVLPTLAHLISLLSQPASQEGSSSDAGSGVPSRPPFRPPAVVVWRGLAAVLPLLRPVLPAALAQLPGLADTVLGALGTTGTLHAVAGAGGPAGMPLAQLGDPRAAAAAPQQQQQQLQPPPSAADQAAVQWYRAGCCAELCRGAGPALWAHTSLPPGVVLEALMAEMEGDAR